MIARRILIAVQLLATEERGDVKKLHVAAPEWRLRVGDWRVRFVFDSPDATIRILRVLPRGRAYRD